MFVLKGRGRRTKITKYVKAGTPEPGYGFAYTTNLKEATQFASSQEALEHVQKIVDATNKRNTTLCLVEVELVPSPVLKEVRVI